MTIVVTGVTGHTGRVAADHLLQRGLPVRVVVRDAARAAAFAARGAEVAVADLHDAEALARAFAGASSAYLIVPPNFGAEDFRAHQRSVVAALADAAARAALPHAVLLSSVGAQHPAGTGPIAGLHEAEAALARGGVATTALRPAYFLENLGSSLGALPAGVFPTFLPASFRFEAVATVDIGATAADLLAQGAAAPKVVELSGPSPIDANLVASTLTELVGRPIAVAEAPVTAMASTLAGHGMPADLAALYEEMTAGIARGHVAFEGVVPLRRGTTDLRTVLTTLLAPAA